VLGVARLLPTGDGSPGGTEAPILALGQQAPDVSGATLDGDTLRLADLRGRPVVVNFWGPSCVPCRNEFPMFLDRLGQRSAEGLVIVGVLMDDPPEPARAFVAEMGATWETVIDPDDRIQRAWQVFLRPQSYFIDGAGIVRAIQIGEMTGETFDRQYAAIAPGS
jgi:cytochrome c biogenesis protein CcmG/thiol:disulfide interchange protein DsbE